MNKIYFYLSLIGILFSLPILVSAQAQAKHKKIGVALSGGGAKGIAHVGVLKVLEEAGIYPDVITGTSMGSIVGGLYAIGYSSKELEDMANTLEWSAYFSDTYERSYRTIEEKETVERYIFSFPFENRKIKLPNGFVDGQKLSILLSKLTMKVHGIDSFDDFQIPFRCIGTDLETGKAVVFDRGSLANAIRASISIPSVFEPKEINDRLIVDGGLSRNLPVQDAFDLGADIVIAVDVGALLYKKEELNSIINVLDQTSSFQIAKFNQQQLNLANVVIRPDISAFSALVFDQPDSLILAGETAARKMLPEILKILNQEQVSQSLRKGILEELPKEVAISNVDIIGLDAKAKVTFQNILQIKKTKKYEIEKIDKQVSRLVATGLFDKMDYQLIPENDSFHLKIVTRKANNFSLKLGANYHSTYNAGLLINITALNTILPGSKFSFDVRISENPALLANYLVYTKTRPNIGFRLTGIGNLYPGFLYLNNTLVDEYNFLVGKTRLDVFSGLGRNISFGVGISAEYKRLDKRFFEEENRNPLIEQITTHLNFNYDWLNRKFFPTRGAQLKLSANFILSGSLQSSIAADSKINTRGNAYNLFSYRQLFPLGPKSVLEWYSWAGNSKFEGTDFTQLFFLGRALPYEERYIPFSGYNYMERPVGDFAFSGLKLQLEPISNIFTALSFNYGVFTTPSFSFIDDNGYNLAPELKDNMSGIGLEVGALSTFGPISLTSEYNFKSENFNFLFQMGFSF